MTTPTPPDSPTPAAEGTQTPINTHKRLFDLVRYQRAELHAANLITDDEYAWLCRHTFKGDPPTGSPSPRRLEDYDDLRAQLTSTQQALAEARRANQTLRAILDSAKIDRDAHHAMCVRIWSALGEVDPEKVHELPCDVQLANQRDAERKMRQTMEARHGEVVAQLATLRTARAAQQAEGKEGEK